MKEISLSIIITLIIFSAHAQKKSDTTKKTNIINTAPVPAVKNIEIPVQPINKTKITNVPITTTNTTTSTNTPTQGSQTTTSSSSWGSIDKPDSCSFPNTNSGWGITTCYTDYYITGLSIKFYTGNDNKEYPSTVDIMVHLPFGSSYSGDPNTPVFLYSNQENSSAERKQEFKSNTTNQIKLKTPYVLFNGLNEEHQPNNLRLAKIKNSGLVIKVTYFPNLLTDAWKINKIEVIPEIKKPDGTLHPLYNNKVISFNLPKLLTSGGGTKNSYVMRIDNALNPGLAY